MDANQSRGHSNGSLGTGYEEEQLNPMARRPLPPIPSDHQIFNASYPHDETMREGAPPTYDEAMREGVPPTYDETMREGAPPTYDEAMREGVPPTYDETMREGAPPTYDTGEVLRDYPPGYTYDKSDISSEIANDEIEHSSGYDSIPDIQNPDDLNDDLQDLEDQEGVEGGMDIEPQVSCMSGEGSMCSNGEIEGESEKIESELQSEEMEGEFQEAEAAMEEAGSVTTEIEASAMKITTELETEGVMLEEEAAAGPPGWIADAVTFVVFSCQIYDIIKGIRSKTALQKEKTDKMIDEVNKAYIKINDKINLYEREKVKIGQEIQLLKDQSDKLDDIGTLEKSELDIQRLEKELSKILNEQGNLITKLDLMLKKEAKLQDRIQGIGQHMEGAEAAISKIIEKVKVAVEHLYDYDPLIKIQAEVLADVCECTNGVINFVIEEGKALKREVIRELEYEPPTTLDKQVQKLFHSIQKVKEGVDKSISQFVNKHIVEPIEKFAEPATQWAAKNILKPLEALSKEIIISHQLVKDLKQNFARMDAQIKEGHEIIDRVGGLIDEEHRIQAELTEEKATILQHEKVALWIEKHPETPTMD